MKLFFRNRTAAQIERDAAAWVIRSERGLTAAEQDEFLQWLAANQCHGREFALQRGHWSRLRLLADWRPENSPGPNRDLLAPKPGARVSRVSTHGPWLLAAAAAVAVGIFFVRNAAPTPSPPRIPAQIASIEERMLSDGSRITLNRGAEVFVRYTTGERHVRLERGEVHFEVATNPGWPFVVSVRDVDVQAVGTAFNVRLDSAAVEVLVTEGRVQVKHVDPPLPAARVAPNAPLPEPAMIEAGHRSVISLGAELTPPAIAAVSADEMKALLAWQPRLLDFTDTPLLEVVMEFNRRNASVRLEIADASLARTEVSASLRSDNVEGFIRLLAVGFGVEAERSGNLIRLRKARSLEPGPAR
jgi:transmembrane sensor